MLNLFLRTLSQGLQAFVPVAAAWTWFRRSDPAAARAIQRGVLLAVPVTLIAAPWFAASTTRAWHECLLAAAALLPVAAFLKTVFASDPPAVSPLVSTGAAAPGTAFSSGHSSPFIRAALLATATVVVLVRQSMEIGATFSAAFFDLRSLDATTAVVGGTMLALLPALAWHRLGRTASPMRLGGATRMCAVVFTMQVVVYGVHESFEARVWPLPEATAALVHEVTEPYGPDGVYGMHVSELLVLLPLAAVIVRRAPRGLAVPVATGLLMAGLTFPFSAALTGGAARAAGATDAGTIMRQPFVAFRDTTPGPTFGQASVVSASEPAGERASAAVSCERVSFAPVLGIGSQGLCLNASPQLFGLFTGYSAVFLDGSLRNRQLTMKLEGKPSRTRISPDGRTGAFTVFVFGDGYTSADFSTRTLLVDMASGRRLADLEEFTTSRNGEPFSARDFNFWGVTFARDGDTFYASLRTAGKTFLVRGSLSRRLFTVLRENVECPSLSPDGRRIAFKKFLGPDPGAWRLATLDLATGQEAIVAGESRYVDDQVEWLDNEHLLYAVPRRTTASSDVWMVAVTGESPARIFIPLAESPVVVR